MRYSLFILVACLALTACGKKKERPERGDSGDPIKQLQPYIPSGWDFRSDWAGSSLKFKDLRP